VVEGRGCGVISSLEEALRAAHSFRAQHDRPVKRFEMSTATLREIERAFEISPQQCASSTLWGIPLVMNEALALNEVRPIYA
jgi:hypothetical protein